MMTSSALGASEHLPRHSCRCAHGEIEISRNVQLPAPDHLSRLVRLAGRLAAGVLQTLMPAAEVGRSLYCGRREIDITTVERAIRPQTLTCRYVPFGGPDGAGRLRVTIATLLATARLNDVDPQSRLTPTLVHIANSSPCPSGGAGDCDLNPGSDGASIGSDACRDRRRLRHSRLRHAGHAPHLGLTTGPR